MTFDLSSSSQVYCDMSSCHCIIPRGEALDTPEPPFLRFEAAHNSQALSVANLRRSRRHTLLFSIDRGYITVRPANSHLLSALLHPQEFWGDTGAISLGLPLSFECRPIIIVKWTIPRDWPRLTRILSRNFRPSKYIACTRITKISYTIYY